MPNQWIEVDSSRLAANMRAFRQRVGREVLLAPVVKSNAYGHGIGRAARAFLSGGADWFCVHSLAEASEVLSLRLGATVLLLGPLAREERRAAVETGCHVMVSEEAVLEDLARHATEVERTALVHIKVETGTHRQGAVLEELGRLLARIGASPRLELVGVHSHFANIEDTTRHEFARSQIERYEQCLELCREKGAVPRVRHMASSAATILFPHTHYDLVRPGVSAYGYWPSRETMVSAGQSGLEDFRLQPALTWKSVLTQVKAVAAGAYVGYGCTERLERDTRLAVVPVGYADGYRRSLSSRAHVLVDGRRCPVRGRVCMNLIIVDVGHVPGAALDREVVLLGQQGDEEITAEQMADWASTINYEILAGIHPDLERREGRFEARP